MAVRERTTGAGSCSERLAAASELVGSVLAEIDPAVLPANDAAGLLDQCVALAKRCDAGVTLLAGRAADSDRWRREGARSAGAWLAGTAGSTKGEAERTIDTSHRLADLDETRDAVRAGRLSAN